MAIITQRFQIDLMVQETPSGLINSTNTTYAISFKPNSAGAVLLFLDGVAQIQGTHYSVSGQTITLATAPRAGSDLFAFYLRA